MGKSSSSVGSSTDSDETSASAPKFKYKQAGDPSVWKATSQNPTKSTYTQLNDVELKTGGYDRADAQLIDLGDDKTLLVYVDEDSRIQGDDRTVLRYQVYDKHETWLGTPGVIQAKNGNTNVNGALEPKLTDAGDKIMITWTAAVLPNATHDDEDYMQKYLKQRNVYVALADKSALRSASSDAPVQIDGELVSTVDASRYNSTPSPLYYKDGDQEYFAVTYLSSEAEAPDDSLTDEEKLIAISSTMTNNSYVRTAEFNTDTNKWETEFDVMKLNSTYNAATQTWTPISDDESLMTDNNPTVIDLDNTVWKDWTVYTFTVDKDNDLSTEEDREVFVKIENFKTGNETVNQLTNDAEYTDAEGTHHLGIAESRPQLIQAAGSLYLFWQSGDSDVAWLDIGSVIDSQDTNGDTGLITNKENTACSFIFYPAYGVDIEPSYNGFKPFVDEKGNLYVVWEQGIEEDGVLKQELYAQALKVSGEESELSYNWSDPARLTRTDAGDYSMVFNDEPAVIAIEDRLLVVCNRFGSTEDGEDTTAHDLSMHGIQFFSDASVKVIDVDTTNTDVGPGSDLDFDVTVKNDGLKSAGGFDIAVYLTETDKFDPQHPNKSATLVGIVNAPETKLMPSETLTIHINNENENAHAALKNSDGRTVNSWKLPDELSESGYVLTFQTIEYYDSSGESSPTIYPNFNDRTFENVFKVVPKYSVNVEGDSYRHDSGVLSSDKFIFCAALKSEGGVAMRDTDRLVVGPTNRDVLYDKDIPEEEYYLDIPLSELETTETENGAEKTITTDLEIDPQRFEYGFTELYYQIRDKDDKAVTSAKTFFIETDAPYYVNVTDKKTDKSLDDTVVLKAGETVSMEGSYEPACHFMDGSVVYSVENTNIASVDENGKLTALSPGTTTLYASVDKYDAVREYTVTVTEGDVFLLGDANRDGVVNVKDATTIQRYLAEFITKADIDLDAADVDGNGTAGIKDVTYIQMYLAEFELEYKIGRKKARIIS